MEENTKDKKDKDVEEITKRMGVIFGIKCSDEEFKYFDRVCKEHFGDSRKTMLATVLSTHFSLGDVLSDINDKLQLLTHLLNRLFELEDRVKKLEDGKEESRTMNDGSKI